MNNFSKLLGFIHDGSDVMPAPDISTRPAIPELYEEDIIADETLDDLPGLDEELHVTYELIEGVDKQGNPLLIDSLGYTYN